MRVTFWPGFSLSALSLPLASVGSATPSNRGWRAQPPGQTAPQVMVTGEVRPDRQFRLGRTVNSRASDIPAQLDEVMRASGVINVSRRVL